MNAKGWNFSLLTIGFALGQGAILVAQSWLVSLGEWQLLAQFGLHFSFAMLAIIVVDGGSLTILSRLVATGASEDDIWRGFWEMSLVRAALALSLVVGALAFLAVAKVDDFSRSYIPFALPGLLLWSVNAAGLLDGQRRGGIGGIAGSMAYLASAGGLVLAKVGFPNDPGVVLGAAFSLGYALSVAAQWVMVGKVRFVAPRWSGTLLAGKLALAMLGATVPGQLYFRGQLLLSTAWLGVEPTAVLVFAKQVISGIGQLIGFMRRVEFPDLVAEMRGTDRVERVFLAQKWGTVLALLAAVGVALVGIILNLTGGSFSSIGGALVLFAPTILSLALALALTQGLAAKAQFAALSAVMALSSLLALGLSALLAPWWGLLGFVVADLVEHALIAALAIVAWKSSGKPMLLRRMRMAS